MAEHTASGPHTVVVHDGGSSTQVSYTQEGVRGAGHGHFSNPWEKLYSSQETIPQAAKADSAAGVQ